MVHMALEKLEKDNVVDLDEDKKAAMVSNLLVVLCADESAQPVLNTGTLNSVSAPSRPTACLWPSVPTSTSPRDRATASARC